MPLKSYQEKILLYIKDPNNHPDIVSAGLISLYIILMGKLVLDRYEALYVFAYDFSVFDQAIWSTSRGELMWQTINTASFGSHFGTHFQPLLILLAPLNYFFPDGRFLLVIQTIMLALGALPIYLIAKLKFRSKWIPVVFPLSYLLYPYLHNVNLYDFHGVSFSPFFIGLAWYSIEKENIKLFTISAMITLLIKENLFVIMLLICVYAFFKTKYKSRTALLAAFSLVYGIVVINFIIPAFSGKPYFFADENLIGNIIVNPPASGFFEITYELFKPLSFLPLLDPVPYLTASILLARHAAQDIDLVLFHHYSADIISLVFISVILGISNVPNYLSYVIAKARPESYKKNKKSRKEGKSIQKKDPGSGSLQLTICIVLVTSSLFFFFTDSQVNNLKPLQYQQTEHDRTGIELLKQIPSDAIVAAQVHLVPRLSHRKYVFMLPEIPEDYKDRVDYVIFDSRAETRREFWPYKNPEEYLKSLNGYAENEKFYNVVSEDGYFIFKRK